MRALALALLIGLAASLPAAPVFGQSAETTAEDKGYLTAFLEENLSGLGRKVTIDGFAGALSSRATFTRMTIADADGVWIIVEGGAVSWNRSALLSGKIEVDELSASAITILRQPRGGGAVEASGGFSLPELPIAVSVGQVTTNRLTLEPAVLGEKVVLSINGQAELAGGAGSASIEVARADGREGRLSLTGTFANDTGQGALDLLVAEGPGGVAARMLRLPGAPAAELALHGAGPADNFVTDLALSTDGVLRASGNLSLTGGGSKDRRFALRLRGDILPLLQPQYRAFFGTNVSLRANGAQLADGGLDLTQLRLESDGVDVSGRLSLSPDRVPNAAALTVRLGLPNVPEVRLPLPGTETYVQNGLLELDYDQADELGWVLNGKLRGFRQQGIRLDLLGLKGAGHVTQTDGAAILDGDVAFDAGGIHLADASLARAIGPEIKGSTRISWQSGQPLTLQGFVASAGDMSVAGDLKFTRDGLDPGVSGNLSLDAPDMARFSGLAGRALGGAARITLSGRGQVLSGAFDLAAKAEGRGLRVGQPQIDRLLAGMSQITLAARRTTEGISLDHLSLEVASLSVTAQGSLQSDMRDLSADLSFSDLSALGAGFGGRLQARASLIGAPGSGEFVLTGQASGLKLGSALSAPVLAGQTDVSLRAHEVASGFALDAVRITNPQGQASIDPDGTDGALVLAAKLNNMALLAPDFPGPVAIEGRLAPQDQAYVLDLSGTGPGNSTVSVKGVVGDGGGEVDLAIIGGARGAILNGLLAPRSIDGPIAFDLRMKGAPALSSLSGAISLSDLRFAAPSDRVAIREGHISADLAGGQAQLDASGQLSSGGTFAVSGSVNLNAPFSGALNATLTRVRIKDPDLFDTTLSGEITIDGPIRSGATIGGALVLHETEVLVSDPSFGSPDPLPVRHINDSPGARATRQRAGLDASGRPSKDSAATYALNLAVSAPGRVFVRGRGLDAELSGEMHLGGTTAVIRPSGQFDLVRGRMDILGKRFVIDEGRAQLIGSLVPYIEFSASTDTVGATATATVDGPVSAPALHFTSTTGLPEEEVIAQLLFGTTLNNASAFQLIQLASAVATLSGRGGIDMAGKLRRNFRLDDLDITVDENGTAALKAGKYLNGKLYSQISVDQNGQAQIDLDLNASKNLTLKGSVGTDGTSGAGVFFSKDY